MSKWEQPYRVFDTPCFPARWKVGRFYDDNNATCNFFINQQDAAVEATKRNKRRNAYQLSASLTKSAVCNGRN